MAAARRKPRRPAAPPPSDDQADTPRPRHPGGRPTKYTPEIGRKIVDGVLLGASYETAAAAAGVHRTTLRAWLRDGARQARPTRPPKPAATDPGARPKLATIAEFSAAMTAAVPAREVRLLGLVTKAASADAKHAQWLLTHLPDTRDRYADPAQRIEHSGGTTSVVAVAEAGEVDLSRFSFDELATWRQLILKGMAPAPSAGGGGDK